MKEERAEDSSQNKESKVKYSKSKNWSESETKSELNNEISVVPEHLYSSQSQCIFAFFCFCRNAAAGSNIKCNIDTFI